MCCGLFEGCIVCGLYDIKIGLYEGCVICGNVLCWRVFGYVMLFEWFLFVGGCFVCGLCYVSGLYLCELGDIVFVGYVL